MINKENIYRYLSDTDYIRIHCLKFEILDINISDYIIRISYT